jgi:hypothetical protein
VFARLAQLLVSEEEGASLVEFAIVSSMLLLPLITFIMSFGSFMTNQMQLINAVDVGARTVSVNGGMTLDPCSIASSAIIAAAPNINSSQLTLQRKDLCQYLFDHRVRSQPRRWHHRYSHRQLSLQPDDLRPHRYAQRLRD